MKTHALGSTCSRSQPKALVRVPEGHVTAYHSGEDSERSGAMKNILIVEDKESLRHLYQTEISEMGHKVILAQNGQEAIDRFCERRPDVFIIELKLPDINGLEVIRKILEFDARVPVIINTAYDNYKQDFTSWAATEYVVKSSDLGELKCAITRALS
jgi:DNA-binding response OmpR family regulator